MNEGKAASLQLRNIIKKYGSQTALQETTLDIPAGRFTSILGPSGCGKTTTLMLIAGLERPTSGHVLVNGEDVTDMPVEKRGIGIVFQNYALFPNLTVKENILYGLRARKASSSVLSERLGEMLELTRLSGLQDRYPGQLSGGQQQRVAIARALAPRPQVLLLDEPLSALDAWSRSSIGEQLKAIQEASGVTTVMVTHDRQEALSLSDFVVVMSSGRVEQAGEPVNVYDHPASEFVATFVGGMNIVRMPTIRNANATGLRYADVKLHRATEAALARPHTFVGQVQTVQFIGDSVRVKVLLNDFQTMITAEALRIGTDPSVFDLHALIAVELPQSAWRTWAE